MEANAKQELANNWVRWFGLGLLCWAGLGWLLNLFTWSLASSQVAAGLFMLWLTPERVPDERVVQLKLRAMTWAYVAGFLAAVIYEHVGRTIFQLKALPSWSVFDLLLMLTATALGLFRYWRWQDGKVQ